jgi:hypothetical protein
MLNSRLAGAAGQVVQPPIKQIPKFIQDDTFISLNFVINKMDLPYKKELNTSRTREVFLFKIPNL